MAASITSRRMRNTRLTGRGFEAPEEVVAWHGAMQAQDYLPAKWSIAQRSRSTEAAIEEAVTDGRIIRTHVLRPTWHFVTREDFRWLIALTGPRVQKRTARRREELGLDARTLQRCAKVIASALSDRTRLSRTELGEVLERRRVDVSGQRLPHVLGHFELEGLICSGGFAGKQHTWALADERVPKGRSVDKDEAIVELVRRHLRSHGPAALQDIGWWSSLTMAELRDAVADLGDEVTSEDADEVTLWSLAAPSRTARPPKGAFLLQAYDELIVGYTVSRFVDDPRLADLRKGYGDRSLPTGVLVVGERLAGHWRRTVRGNAVKVEVLTYDKLTAEAEAAVEKEVGRLARFLERVPSLKFGRV